MCPAAERCPAAGVCVCENLCRGRFGECDCVYLHFYLSIYRSIDLSILTPVGVDAWVISTASRVSTFMCCWRFMQVHNLSFIASDFLLCVVSYFVVYIYIVPIALLVELFQSHGLDFRKTQPDNMHTLNALQLALDGSTCQVNTCLGISVCCSNAF